MSLVTILQNLIDSNQYNEVVDHNPENYEVSVNDTDMVSKLLEKLYAHQWVKHYVKESAKNMYTEEHLPISCCIKHSDNETTPILNVVHKYYETCIDKLYNNKHPYACIIKLQLLKNTYYGIEHGDNALKYANEALEYYNSYPYITKKEFCNIIAKRVYYVFQYRHNITNLHINKIATLFEILSIIQNRENNYINELDKICGNRLRDTFYNKLVDLDQVFPIS